MTLEQINQTPHLRIVWHHRGGMCWDALYELAIPLRKGDVRNNGSNLLLLKIGDTTVTSENAPFRGHQLRTPFRDGVHVLWDKELLNLPAYIIFEDRIQAVTKDTPR